MLDLSSIAVCEKGIAVVNLGSQPDDKAQRFNFFRGIRLLNKLNKVKFSSKMDEWQSLPEKPTLCWDETRYPYPKPSKTLTKLCINFPFVANLKNLPAKQNLAYFPTEIGD